MPEPLRVTFAGGSSGAWQIDRIEAVRGVGLPVAERLEVFEGEAWRAPDAARWVLRGVTSDERYVTRTEHDELVSRQPALGRLEATRAALIPIRKSQEWWKLPPDERRAIFAASSHHVRTGLEYLPAVARRLHHSRDLGEPLNFLTWFEFAPIYPGAFDELVGRLRDTAEWEYVEREVDVRARREVIFEPPQAGLCSRRSFWAPCTASSGTTSATNRTSFETRVRCLGLRRDGKIVSLGPRARRWIAAKPRIKGAG